MSATTYYDGKNEFCPSCGAVGYEVTYLGDTRHRYICASLDCNGPIKRWLGATFNFFYERDSVAVVDKVVTVWNKE